MAADPSAKQRSTDAPTPVPDTPLYAKSRSYRVLVQADSVWRFIGAATLGAASVVALIVAIVKFNGVALALGLIFLPFALILWLSARGMRDAGPEL